MSQEVTHVIFDFDGTLVNTIDVVMDVLTQYAQSHSQQLSLDIQRKVANVIDIPVFFNEFLNSISVPNDKSEDIMKQLMKTFFSKKFDLIPGVEKLVKHLYKHNIPMAVATACSKERFLVHRLQFQEFFSKYFTHLVFASDDPEVGNTKPHPEVYYVCADRFEPKPESVKNILVVEDSLIGITGAIDSGMKTLLINDRKLCDFEGISDKITKICDTFNDFKPESVGLPSYD